MIDLTPLDVRNKRGDFKKIMRGYDPQEVDVFLEIAAERLEVLVRETLHLRERTQLLEDQVSQQADRERAVQDALVSAQSLRADIEAQTQRESEQMIREAQSEAKQLLANAEAEVRRLLIEADDEVRSRVRGIERRVDQASSALEDLERSRVRFLKEFGSLLERESQVVRVEMDRTPFDERAIEMDLGGRAGVGSGSLVGLGARTADGAEEAPVDATATAAEGEQSIEDVVEVSVDSVAPQVEAADLAPDIDPEPATASEPAAALESEIAVEAEVPTIPDPVVVGDLAPAEELVELAATPENDASELQRVAEPVDDPEPDEAPMPDGAEAPSNVAPTLEELKAEMDATLGLGVMAVPVTDDQPPLRAEEAVPMPPPLPEGVAESQPLSARYVPSESELIIEAADEPTTSTAEADYLEVGPVDPTPETWSEPVSTLELAPDLPVADAVVEAGSEPPAGSPIDITSLRPEPEQTPAALEGGLAALDTRGTRGAGPFEGVPDLETVLAEAGIEEVVPPPLDEPASRSIGGERDNMILFEPEDHERSG